MPPSIAQKHAANAEEETDKVSENYASKDRNAIATISFRSRTMTTEWVPRRGHQKTWTFVQHRPQRLHDREARHRRVFARLIIGWDRHQVRGSAVQEGVASLKSCCYSFDGCNDISVVKFSVNSHPVGNHDQRLRSSEDGMHHDHRRRPQVCLSALQETWRSKKNSELHQHKMKAECA